MPLSVVGAAVLAEGFKLSMLEAMEYLKKRSSSFNIENKLNVENVFGKALNVEMVKTIWQIDKTVNLNEFYHPSKIIIDEKHITVETISTFPEESKVVIEGIAGQGKSILLRYLSGKELKFGDRIPLFIELRKITPKNSITGLIVKAISDLEIKVDTSNLDLIYSSRKFILLLDAFDEIPSDQIVDTLSYIESLCSQYHYLQIIITSRPNFDIQKSNAFNVYKLLSINVNDFRPLLNKFFKEKENNEVDQIMKSIHSNQSGVIGFVTTPLLLTLLAITYKGSGHIPESPHEFYDNIFSLLINRHDSTKPGFKRETKSQLNENDLEKLFCAFCFYCMHIGKSSLTQTEAIECVSKAKRYTGIVNFSENYFITDCVKNTCLIVKDGFDFHFIHKSIMEFHAAKFIRQSEIGLKAKFYSAALLAHYNYVEELKYLHEIDHYYFTKLYLVPSYENFFKSIEGLEGSHSLVIDYIGQHQLTIRSDRTDRSDRFDDRFDDRLVVGVEHCKIEGGIGGLTQDLMHLIAMPLFDADFSHVTLSSKNQVKSAKEALNFDHICKTLNKTLDDWLSEKKTIYLTLQGQIKAKEDAINSIEF